jgi:glycine/D-amino acid oxidase-like deaminating enzyme
MRGDAAVVVAGGGIVGCSIAYHLAVAGCRDVVLVEKGGLTSGTTFHSVGLVSQFRTSPADTRLMSYSIRLYRELADEMVDAAGWRPVGSLRLASGPAMLRGLQRSVSRARALGLDVGIITPGEDGAGCVWDAVMAAGVEFGIEPVGYYALTTPRLEKCFCYRGDDICPGDTPLEADLCVCVRCDEGDFLGRDALLRQRAAGLRRKLVPLVLEAEACVLWGGEAVVVDGRVVGRIRSEGYGYTMGRNIGLAYLPLALARPGTAMAVESLGQLVPAEVGAAPLWDPRGERVRV